MGEYISWHQIEEDKPRTECGISALYLHPSLASKGITEKILKVQLQNNHRGEESAGVCVSDGYSVSIPMKEMGLVKNLYKIYQKTKSKDYGHMGIGHNRYSTTGTSNLENAAPFRHMDPQLGIIATAFNGNITNALELKMELQKKGVRFKSTTDSEVIGEMIIASEGKNWDEKITNAIKRFEGAFNIVLLTNDSVYAVRDRFGFHPLSIAYFHLEEKLCYCVSSETPGFSDFPIEDVQNVPRGSLLKIHDGQLTSFRYVDVLPDEALCGLEIAYLQRPDSYVDGVQLDTIRRFYHGAKLAQMYPVPTTVDAVTYIPESAKSAAEGYQEKLEEVQSRKIPIRTSLVKGRYGNINGGQRSFINPDKNERIKMAGKGYFPFEWVRGLELVVVDDSVIRGTVTGGAIDTLKERVGMLRNGGAKKIHLRIVFPQVTCYCPFGVDINELDFLLAKEFDGDLDRMAQYLGADSLAYLTLDEYGDEVDKALKMHKGLCMGCVTGNYPTHFTRAVKFILEEEIG